MRLFPFEADLLFNSVGGGGIGFDFRLILCLAEVEIGLVDLRAELADFVGGENGRIETRGKAGPVDRGLGCYPILLLNRGTRLIEIALNLIADFALPSLYIIAGLVWSIGR